MVLKNKKNILIYVVSRDGRCHTVLILIYLEYVQRLIMFIVLSTDSANA